MQVQRYNKADQRIWDDFVRLSKNGTFLFERSYMDYHSDRFTDHSLMFYDDKGKLLALLPANEVSETKRFYSHQGLTYGGFVLHKRAHAADVLSLFELTSDYLKSAGFVQWFYKPVPTIYHRLPSQEEEYALFRHGATLEVCNLSSSLLLQADSDVALVADASRRHRRKEAEMMGMRLIQGGRDLPADEVLRRFWPIMEQNMMERYGARPVHSLEEMLLLHQRFPRQIRCYLVAVTDPETQTDIDLAGEVLFVSQQVAHAQYGHASARGRALGALDFLYLNLIDYFREEETAIQYFDFGTSNEQGGQILNTSLIAQKEGFGGRGIAYKTYRIDL